MLTVLVGSISTLLASTIVNVAFPAMMRDLAVTHDTIQWVATGFLAATTTTMLGTAWSLERYGESRTFVAAMAVFALGSVVGAFAPNIGTLIAARVLQGAAAGMVQPLAMVALFRVFPVEERGRAMGLYGFGIVLAPAVGPAVGGWMVEVLGWRSIFFVPLPFCLAGLVMALRVLAGARAAPDRTFDLGGTVLLILGLVVLLNVPVAGHRYGWSSVTTLALAAAGIALAVGFTAWEMKSRQPLLRVGLFRHAGFRGAAAVAFAYGAGLFGTTYLFPVFVQQGVGFGATDAGLLLAPAGVALAFAMVGGGRLTDAFAPSKVIIAGLLLFAVSTALFTRAGTATGFWAMAWWLVLGRIGLGLIIPALNVGAVQSLTGSELAYGSAAVNFIRQIGGAVGVNLLAVMLEWRVATHPEVPILAFHECFWAVTIVFVLAAFPARAIRPR